MLVASRTRNASLNAAWAILSQVAIAILGLVCRKVFLDHLGAELLGVNSLFADVLLLFSFADLGFGVAIMFSMYKPIAENDDAKVQSLLLFYRSIYNYVILALLVISFAFVPFLKYLNTEIPTNELFIYYLLFQITNIAEYIWAYRESYVIACQRERELSIATLIYNTTRTLLQIISLIVLEDFVAYLVIGVVCLALKKIIVNSYIKKKYPITVLENVEPLPQAEKKVVLRKSMALLVTKIGNLIINQTDSLIVSYIINVVQWGLVSNYLMIKRAVFVVTDKIYSAVLPSVGNLVASNQREKELNVFLKYDYLNSWLHTFCFIGLACLSSPFVALFFGKDYTLANFVVFMIFYASFIDGLRSPVSVLREASGTFEVDKWYTILAAIVNVAVSIPCAFLWGLSGVYLGTICAMTVLHICRTLVLFAGGKYSMNAWGYLRLLLIHAIVGLILYKITSMILIPVDSFIDNIYVSFVLKLLIVLFVPNVLWLLFNIKNKYQVEFITLIKDKINNRKQI